PSPATSWPPSSPGGSTCPPARSPPCSAATAPPSATSSPAPASSWPPPPPPSRPDPTPWPATRTCATTPPPTASPSPPRQTPRICPQHATLATPGTPQTHLKKRRVLDGGKGPLTHPTNRLHAPPGHRAPRAPGPGRLQRPSRRGTTLGV